MAKKKRTAQSSTDKSIGSVKQTADRAQTKDQDVANSTSAKRTDGEHSPLPDTVPAATKQEEQQRDECVVVGIGASAGGLEAFKQFFAAMPADSEMAFVLIQHLDPTHESMMVELLSKYTPMKVQQAADGMEVIPNNVYMIPPNHYLSLSEHRLHLTSPVKFHGMRMPIDHFFRSLATDRQERAICIVLSGTGSDGTLGLKAVKAAGGLAIVEHPTSAQYDGMPRSAVGTGLVDFVLPIDQMPDALIKYVASAYIKNHRSHFAETAPDHLKAILSILQARCDFDFRCYKKGTLTRRIERRMGMNHIDQIADYVKLLRGNTDEVKGLFKDLLISVTSFFRDAESFEALEEVVIAPIVESKQNFDEPVRVWVPGCATGEEAYTIGMMLFDQFAKTKKNLNAQVFATDIDEDAVDYARNGVYPANIAADIPPGRLQKFFNEEGDHYHVKKRLREAAVFAVQNLIGDPPFSNIDLICCRNVLIYLESNVQQKVLALFHFALREGGYLFLGNSESIGKQAELFEPVSKLCRIYRKLGPTRRGRTEFPIIAGEEHILGKKRLAPPQVYVEPLGAVDLARKSLLENFAPAAVMVNRQYDILYFHGPTRNYLSFPTGEPTRDLTALALEGMKSKLRGVIHKAVAENETARTTARRVRRGDGLVSVRITAQPIETPKGQEDYLLVSFQDEPVEAPAAAHDGEPSKGGMPTDADAKAIEQLEYELQATREDLQSTIEELETSNEELKASNEEVMSMNEELQSTNEELETSREELQSLNEELSTVNNQLEDKVHELDCTNNDLVNLLTSTDIATIFLDTQLCIRRFTPATAQLFRMIASDVGRPVQDIAPQVKDDDLLADAQRVLEKLAPIEKQVQNGGEHWYVRRILPYRTSDNKIEGVVITFTDITEIRSASEQVAVRERQQAVVARLGRDALAGNDLQSLFNTTVKEVAHVLDVKFCKVLELTHDHYRLLLRAGLGWKKGLVGKAIVSAGLDSQAGFTLHTEAPIIVKDLADEKRFTGPKLLTDHGVVSGMSVVIHGRGNHFGVLGAHTERQVEFSMDDVNFLQSVANVLAHAIDRHEAEQRLRGILTSLSDAFMAFDRDWRFTYVNQSALQFLEKTEKQLLGKVVWDMVPEMVDTPFDEDLHRAADENCTVTVEEYYPPHQRWYNCRCYPWADGLSVYFNDITERKWADEALRESEERVRRIVDSALDAVITMDDQGLVTGWNPQAQHIFGWTPDEAFGQSLADLIVPESQREAHKTGLERYLQTGEGPFLNRRIELETLRKNGAAFPVELTVVALRIGERQEFCGCIRDITERKRAEETQARLATIVGSSHDAIIGTTIKGKITAWNAGAERMYGYTPEESIGQPISMLLPPDRPQEVTELLEQLKQGEPIENFETVRQTKDDRQIEVSLTISPLVDRNDRIVGTSTIARDITERKRTEIKLRLLQSVTDAISSSRDFESAMEKALLVICETIGWDYGEAWIPSGDQNALQRCPGAYLRTAALEPFAQASSKLTLQTDEGLPGQVWSSREPAWYLDVSSQPPQAFLRADTAAAVGLKGGFAVPIVADDEVLVVLGSFMMSKAREEDLALVIDLVNSVASQLGSVVRRKQSDAELQNALAELENKNREMEDFVYTVSHDLKTPLVTLGGMLGMLKEELQQEQIVDTGEIIATAEGTVEGMGNSIADLLKLSRLGRVACELEPLNFNELSREIIGKHAAQLEAKDVGVEITAEDVTVTADRNRLGEALNNIITNALKYACDGPDARVVIGCEAVGNEIRAFVRDNGPGIAEEDREKVFGLFQRLNMDKDGSGVGLTIVRRIMEAHGGQAWVESEVGAGATFWLTFPSPVSEPVPSR